MSGAATVRALFERMEAGDWDGARATLHDELVVEWPHSGERFSSAEAFIGMQRAYPEGWHIEVSRVVEDPPIVIAEIRVTQAEAVFQCVGVYEVPGERIARGTEYWVKAGSEEPPAWRRRFTEP